MSRSEITIKNQPLTPRRVALVTGGIGGLGTEICRQLAMAGRQMIATYLAARDERLAAFHDEVTRFDGAIVFEPADVSDFDSCRQLVERIG